MTTTLIDPNALRFARERAGLSQRKLGRRVAERLGRDDDAIALHSQLRRIEQGNSVSDADREFLDALAAELGIGRADLGTPPTWVFVRVVGGVPEFVALGVKLVAFSTPERAFDARDALALVSGGVAQPFADATPISLHAGALTELLVTNFRAAGPDALLLDAEPEALNRAWLLQLALNGDTAELSGGVEVDPRDVIAQVALETPAFEAELPELHWLARRRLEASPVGENPALYARWAREETALLEILDRVHRAHHDGRDAWQAP
jgi:transcriptional regulator with XRE-family HTH domain